MVIQNTAHIYFDLNEAVVTNTTENYLPLGIEDRHIDGSWVRVSPNPSNGVFRLWSGYPGKYEVFDGMGSLLKHGEIDGEIILEMKMEPNGVYIVVVSGDHGILSKKLILSK